jgi:hypothetical protein
MSYVGQLGTKAQATSASSVVITLTAAAAAGSSIVGGAVLKFTTAPTSPAVTDTHGNTYVIDAQDIPNTYCIAFRSNGLTHALAIGDTITISWTGTATEAEASADNFTGTLYLDGTASWDTTHLAVATQTISETRNTVVSSDIAYCVFASFGGQTASTSTIAAPFTKTSFANALDRALVTGYALGTGGSMTATMTWKASHTGTGIVLKYAPTPVVAPVANAGVDQSHAAGVQVTLDGTASTGDSITYSWSHTSGPYTGGLSDSTIAQPTYTPTTSGVDVWTLTVTDAHATTATDTVSVTATNRAPTARITGPTQSALGMTVTLDGSTSSDPDTGDTLTYAWTGTSGPNVSGATGTSATFVYAANGPGTDVVTLVVTDNHGSASATATISVLAGATGARIRVNGTWVPAKLKIRSSGAWVAV